MKNPRWIEEALPQWRERPYNRQHAQELYGSFITNKTMNRDCIVLLVGGLNFETELTQELVDEMCKDGPVPGIRIHPKAYSIAGYHTSRAATAIINHYGDDSPEVQDVMFSSLVIVHILS